MKRNVWLVALVATLLTLSPQLLAGEEAVPVIDTPSSETAASPELPAVEAAEALETVDPEACLAPEQSQSSESEQAASTQLTWTCVECSVHEDCQGVCPGVPIYDFLCSWSFDVCGPGVRIKQCLCL